MCVGKGRATDPASLSCFTCMCSPHVSERRRDKSGEMEGSQFPSASLHPSSLLHTPPPLHHRFHHNPHAYMLTLTHTRTRACAGTNVPHEKGNWLAENWFGLDGKGGAPGVYRWDWGQQQSADVGQQRSTVVGGKVSNLAHIEWGHVKQILCRTDPASSQFGHQALLQLQAGQGSSCLLPRPSAV